MNIFKAVKCCCILHGRVFEMLPLQTLMTKTIIAVTCITQLNGVNILLIVKTLFPTLLYIYTIVQVPALQPRFSSLKRLNTSSQLEIEICVQ